MKYAGVEWTATGSKRSAMVRGAGVVVDGDSREGWCWEWRNLVGRYDPTYRTRREAMSAAIRAIKKWRRK